MECADLFGKLKRATPFFIITGPCAIESREHALFMARSLKAIADRLELPFIFKSSFDKANRTSDQSARGVGLEEGLSILKEVKDTVGVPVLTDVHETIHVQRVAEVVDVLQIPAFLCRQTDLLHECGKTMKPIHIKKGQMISPSAIAFAVDKIRSTGNDNMMVCERGFCFGYGDLVFDPRSVPIMRAACKCPVVVDCTHSAQVPSTGSAKTGGNRGMIATLARTACAVGVDGLFMEVHDRPAEAISDADTQFPLDRFERLLTELKLIGCASQAKHTNYVDEWQ